MGQNTDGRLEIFAYGANDIVYNNWQLTPGGDYSGWSSLGRPQYAPATILGVELVRQRFQALTDSLEKQPLAARLFRSFRLFRAKVPALRNCSCKSSGRFSGDA